MPPLWSRPVAPWRERHAGRTRCCPDDAACRRAGRGPSGRCSSAGDRPVDRAGRSAGSSFGMLAWLSQLFGRPAGAAPDLHEPHAALEQPPGDQAAAAEVGGRGVVEAVEVARCRRLRRSGRAPRARAAASGGQLVGLRCGLRAASRRAASARARGSAGRAGPGRRAPLSGVMKLASSARQQVGDRAGRRRR